MKKKLSLIIISLGIAVILILVFVNQSAKADFAGEFLGQKEFIQNIDGKNHNFEIKTYKNGMDFHSYLIEDRFLNSNYIELTGFEDNVLPCQNNPVQLGGDLGEAICLINVVGAHSQNLMLIQYQNGNFSDINFSTPERTGKNITSDVPNMIFKDFDNDGNIDLAVDNRNYDLDPISSAIRSYYSCSKEGFIFDRSENITYN